MIYIFMLQKQKNKIFQKNLNKNDSQKFPSYSELKKYNLCKSTIHA